MKILILTLLLALSLISVPAWAARDFNGTSDYITFADTNSLSFTAGGGVDSSASMCGWFRKTSFTNNKPFMTKDQYGTPSLAEMYFLVAADKIYFELSTLGAVYIQITVPFTSASYLNVWAHICATYSGSEAYTGMNIYINGTAGSVTNASSGSYTGVSNTAQPFHYGFWDNLPAYYTGQMANLRVYSVELSAAEVAMDRLGIIVRPEKVIMDTKLYGLQSPESDSTGNGHTGTLTGTARFDHPPSIVGEWQ